MFPTHCSTATNVRAAAQQGKFIEGLKPAQIPGRFLWVKKKGIKGMHQSSKWSGRSLPTNRGIVVTRRQRSSTPAPGCMKEVLHSLYNVPDMRW
ncbi:MAG: hypothetical protein ABIU77_04190 [Ferruginibacter sp.]